MHGYYASDDRIVLQFVFMPILRREVAAFMETHNALRIRPQHDLGHHISGVPNDLYVNVESCGYDPDPDLLHRLSQSVNSYDLDAYLSEETLAWCLQALAQLTDGEPKASDFIVIRPGASPSRFFSIPQWYPQLLAKARQQVSSGEAPILALAPKPVGGYGWDARPIVVDTIAQEIDTFGLENSDAEDSDEI
jgi:hypothetical protein